jgi:nuclease HARBI1
MSRIVKQTCDAIASLRAEYIFMPRNDQDLKNMMQLFYQLGSFPSVIGTIDCTHIKIKSPGGPNAEIYRNRKQYFSLNVQSVASAKLQFQDIVARWPGSVHDGHIFRTSTVKAHFEDGKYGKGLLLGDGGYKLTEYLITPYRNAEEIQQKKFNKAQIKTRKRRKSGGFTSSLPVIE